MLRIPPRLLLAGTRSARDRAEWKSESGYCSVNRAVKTNGANEGVRVALRDDRCVRAIRYARCETPRRRDDALLPPCANNNPFSETAWRVTPANSSPPPRLFGPFAGVAVKTWFTTSLRARRGGHRKWAINETIARRSTPPARFSRNYVVIVIYVTARAIRARTRAYYAISFYCVELCTRGERERVRESHIAIDNEARSSLRLTLHPSSFLVMQKLCIILSEIDHIFFWRDAYTYLDVCSLDEAHPRPTLSRNPQRNESFSARIPHTEDRVDRGALLARATRSRFAIFAGWIFWVRIIALCHDVTLVARYVMQIVNYFVEIFARPSLLDVVPSTRDEANLDVLPFTISSIIKKNLFLF